MKKLTIILCAFMALISCNKEQQTQEPTDSKTYKISIDLSSTEVTPASKVSYTDGTGIKWVKDETIGLINEGHNYQSFKIAQKDISEDNFTADFYVEGDEGTYTIYQPYRSSSSNNAIAFRIEPVQEQERPGFMDTWYASRLPLISKEPITLSNTNSYPHTGYNGQFKVIGSLLRFFVGDTRANADNDEIVRSIKVEALNNAPLSGKILCTNNGEITGTDGEWANSVRVDSHFEELPIAVQNGTGLYAVVIPATIAANEDGTVEYRIRTNKAEYYFTSKRAVEWENGYLYDIELNLAKATRIVENTVPDRLFFVSGTTSWESHNAEAMTKNGKKFSISRHFDFGSYPDFQFRFAAHRTNGATTDNYVNASGDNKTISYSKEYDGDHNFALLEGSGTYTITADFEANEVIVTPPVPEKLYFISGECGWNAENAPEITEKDGGKFILRRYFTQNFSFRLAKDKSGSNCYVNGGNNTIEFCNYIEHDKNFSITEGFGWYTVTCDLAERKVTMHHERPYILGDPWNNWGSWTDDNKMERVKDENNNEVPGIFTIKKFVSGFTGNDKSFKFTADQSYNNSYVRSNYAMNGYGYFPNPDTNIAIEPSTGNDYKWYFKPEDGCCEYQFTLDTKVLSVVVTAFPKFKFTGAQWGWNGKGSQSLTSDFEAKTATWEGKITSTGLDSDFKMCLDGTTDYGDGNGLWLFADKDQEGIDLQNGKVTLKAGETFNIKKTEGAAGGDIKWRFKSDQLNHNVRITVDWSNWNNWTISLIDLGEAN